MSDVDELKFKALKMGEEETEGWKMLINNRFVESSSGQRYTIMNPSLDQPISEVPSGDQRDVELAVKAARNAFPAWAKLDIEQRAKYLREFANALLEKKDELGMLDALNSGNPYQSMVQDVKNAVSLLEYYIGIAPELKGETIPTAGGGLNYTRRQPYGVVAQIIPFNHPLSFAAGKIAAPLIAGNTIVLKPAEQTPLSALLMGKIVQGIFPPGVVNILTGDGHNCGASLVQHPFVRRIAFTGGVDTGRRIIKQAGIKNVTLELGGKNPFIVYPDVNVQEAADAAVLGMNFTRSQGQSCGSNSRVFVHKNIFQPFVDRVIQKVSDIKVGLAYRDDTQMGPVVSRVHYDRVMSYIRSGSEEGAEIVCGGSHSAGPDLQDGYFIDPTVFVNVKHGMTIEKEEIFGPVMSILTWDDENKLLHDVNDVDYGLAANIWTNDIKTALRMADAIEAGYILVNGQGTKRFKGAPFGGYKDSGIGREQCFDELLGFTQIKNVNVRY